MKFLSYAAPLAGVASLASALTLDITSKSSVQSVTSNLAYNMMTYYSGNQTGQTPGILPGPCASTSCYYWWEAGAMWASLINYAQYTGDTSYNPVVLQALEWQIGPDKNYNPPNQSKNMGIDDQDFWGFAAMEAAEAGVPDSTVSGVPSWLALAQAVFNFQSTLWDTATCGGGFRWQVYPFNAGYNLKNAISNGGFFQLASRLARYTGNQTYADWAEKVWDWMAASPLIQYQDNIMYIWDNTDADNNCTDVENYVWTYNYGTMLMGSAMMYNYTNGSAVWKTRVDNILAGSIALFFPEVYGVDNNTLNSNIMVEYLCEAQKNCNNDQSSFKAYLARWMAVTSLLVPYTAATIKPKLATSAAGAAQQCTGGTNGQMCGRQWYTSWDGTSGVGQQVSPFNLWRCSTLTYLDVCISRDRCNSNRSIDGPLDRNYWW